MIEARDVSKFYPPHTLALDKISFSIDRGEVVGFVGPNGAGKSTTMRILTTYHPPTSGSATVQGYDVVRQSHSVRTCIGYLPESNPLYNHLRVGEYLMFRARLKGLSRKEAWHRVGACADRCGVAQVRSRIIGQLSKGYRQRVGLTETLLSDPPVLILDEPTIGLDPGQNQDVRKLISGLSEKKTVLFSTHILSEVEKLCDRVMVIIQGRIKAVDTVEGLQKKIGRRERLEVTLKIPSGEVPDKLKGLAGIHAVKLVSREGERHRLHIDGEPDGSLREQIFTKAGQWGWLLEEMKGRGDSLEETFLTFLSPDKARKEGGDD